MGKEIFVEIVGKYFITRKNKFVEVTLSRPEKEAKFKRNFLLESLYEEIGRADLITNIVYYVNLIQCSNVYWFVSRPVSVDRGPRYSGTISILLLFTSKLRQYC